jgi:hypothetical protein
MKFSVRRLEKSSIFLKPFLVLRLILRGGKLRRFCYFSIAVFHQSPPFVKGDLRDFQGVREKAPLPPFMKGGENSFNFIIALVCCSYPASAGIRAICGSIK